MGRVTDLRWFEWLYLGVFWSGVVYVYRRIDA